MNLLQDFLFLIPMIILGGIFIRVLVVEDGFKRHWHWMSAYPCTYNVGVVEIEVNSTNPQMEPLKVTIHGHCIINRSYVYTDVRVVRASIYAEACIKTAWEAGYFSTADHDKGTRKIVFIDHIRSVNIGEEKPFMKEIEIY